MRVIKLYEDFEPFIGRWRDKSKVISDINDIFIELFDMGLKCVVSFSYSNSEILEILIYKVSTNISDIGVDINLHLINDMVEMLRNYVSELSERFVQTYEVSYSMFKDNRFIDNETVFGNNSPNKAYNTIRDSSVDTIKKYGRGISYVVTSCKINVELR